MSGCNHLGGISRCGVAPCAPFPFLLHVMICLPCLFVPTVGFLRIFTRLLTSMHESCLLVCRPCFNTMKLWTSDPNLHLSLTDTTLVYLLSCFVSLFCLHPGFYVCHVYHVYLLYASLLCSLHLFLRWLLCRFLVFSFACTHMEQGCMELRHSLPGASKRGKDMSTRI